jgi:hypothetical protein
MQPLFRTIAAARRTCFVRPAFPGCPHPCSPRLPAPLLPPDFCLLPRTSLVCISVKNAKHRQMGGRSERASGVGQGPLWSTQCKGQRNIIFNDPDAIMIITKFKPVTHSIHFTFGIKSDNSSASRKISPPRPTPLQETTFSTPHAFGVELNFHIYVHVGFLSHAHRPRLWARSDVKKKLEFERLGYFNAS